MRKAATVFLVLAMATPTLAEPGIPVYGQQVRYVGGTAPNLKAGTIGRLNTTLEDQIVFEAGEGRLAIRYSDIQKFQYEEKRARRMGVIATVVVVMLKHRQRRHFFEINYRTPEGTPQVAVFEVSKDNAQVVDAVLGARAARQSPTTRSLDCARYPGATACQSAMNRPQP